jgi:hypothetical protein
MTFLFKAREKPKNRMRKTKSFKEISAEFSSINCLKTSVRD